MEDSIPIATSPPADLGAVEHEPRVRRHDEHVLEPQPQLARRVLDVREVLLPGASAVAGVIEAVP
jgi:hypothetical protein